MYRFSHPLSIGRRTNSYTLFRLQDGLGGNTPPTVRRTVHVKFTLWVLGRQVRLEYSTFPLVSYNARLREEMLLWEEGKVEHDQDYHQRYPNYGGIDGCPEL